MVAAKFLRLIPRLNRRRRFPDERTRVWAGEAVTQWRLGRLP